MPPARQSRSRYIRPSCIRPRQISRCIIHYSNARSNAVDGRRVWRTQAQKRNPSGELWQDWFANSEVTASKDGLVTDLARYTAKIFRLRGH